MFVTTSDVSMLKMLNVHKDFAEEVAVPAVASLSELASVLQASRGVFNAEDINEILNNIQQRTGSQTFGLGIKIVLDCIVQAKQGGPDSNIPEKLANLLVKKIQALRD